MRQVPVSFQSAAPNPGFPGVTDVDPQELTEKQELVELIDVRRHDEWISDLGHIAGAKLILLDTLPERLAEIPQDKTVVFVCRSGGRSANAAAYAMEHGYRNVFNMKGGMLRWNQLGFPIDRSPYETK